MRSSRSGERKSRVVYVLQRMLMKISKGMIDLSDVYHPIALVAQNNALPAPVCAAKQGLGTKKGLVKAAPVLLHLATAVRTGSHAYCEGELAHLGLPLFSLALRSSATVVCCHTEDEKIGPQFPSVRSHSSMKFTATTYRWLVPEEADVDSEAGRTIFMVNTACFSSEQGSEKGTNVRRYVQGIINAHRTRTSIFEFGYLEILRCFQPPLDGMEIDQYAASMPLNS